MPSIAESTAFAGALGSVIGYVGSEVAEESIFERLLWPQRFYYRLTPKSAFGLALMMPMGGPLHKAALETLEAFRRRGLYKGMQQGHMLGTAFFCDSKLKYTIHGYSGNDKDVEVRNGMWVRVLQDVCHEQVVNQPSDETKGDTEWKGEEPHVERRTSQWVHHLKLCSPESSKVPVTSIDNYSEGVSGLKTYTAIVLSELSAVPCATVIICWQRCYWFAGYLFVPLLLKLLAVPCSVRRGPDRAASHSQQDENDVVVCEVSDYDHGFPVIQGPEYLVRQFFKHWGHPLRQTKRDRYREITSMALVVSFVFFFPAGLLSMLWVPEPVQTIWLLYQIYMIVVMHLNRLIGFDGFGRMEAAMANSLSRGRVIRLTGGDGSIIEASLESHAVTRIAHGQKKLDEIIQHHIEGRLLKQADRADSADSQVSTVCGDDDSLLKPSAK